MSVLRGYLLDNGYAKLSINSEHTVYVKGLPLIHKDSFDHMLIAKSSVEAVTLLISDSTVVAYVGSGCKV